MTEGPIHEIAELDLTVATYDWPFARDRAEEIRAHWEARRLQTPGLFDGRILLTFRQSIEPRPGGGLKLKATYFETNYSNFLAWRDFGFPDKTISNTFSMAALRSSDGAFLLGQMADTTANAGQTYFAAGTPDPSDVFDGRMDLRASVMRELKEETGVSAEATTFDETWIVVFAPPKIACMKIMRLAVDAETAKANIEAWLRSEKDPELSAIHIVRRLEDLEGKKTPEFMPAFLRSVL